MFMYLYAYVCIYIKLFGACANVPNVLLISLRKGFFLENIPNSCCYGDEI